MTHHANLKIFFGIFGWNSPLGKYYVVIKAKDIESARTWFAAQFPIHWFSVYEEHHFDNTIEKFHLINLKQLDMPMGVGEIDPERS